MSEDVLVSILITLFFCVLIMWLEPVENYLPRDIKVIINNLKKKERGEPVVATEEPVTEEPVTEEPVTEESAELAAELEVVFRKPPKSGPVEKPLKPLKPGDMAKPLKPMKSSLNPFELYDKNDDNFLTEDELKDGGAPAETITMLMGYDLNKDGKLSPSELTNIKPPSKQKDHGAEYMKRMQMMNSDKFWRLVRWEFVFAVSSQDEKLFDVYSPGEPKGRYSRYHPPSNYRYQGLRDYWDDTHFTKEKYYYQWDPPPTKDEFVADTKKKLKVERMKKIMLDKKTDWAQDNRAIFGQEYLFSKEKLEQVFQEDWLKNKSELTLDEFYKLYVSITKAVGVKDKNDLNLEAKVNLRGGEFRPLYVPNPDDFDQALQEQYDKDKKDPKASPIYGKKIKKGQPDP